MGFAEIEQARIDEFEGYAGDYIANLPTGQNQAGALSLWDYLQKHRDRITNEVARPVVYAVPCDQCEGDGVVEQEFVHSGGDVGTMAEACKTCLLGVVYVLAPCPTCDGEMEGALTVVVGNWSCADCSDGTIKDRLCL